MFARVAIKCAPLALVLLAAASARAVEIPIHWIAMQKGAKVSASEEEARSILSGTAAMWQSQCGIQLIYAGYRTATPEEFHLKNGSFNAFDDVIESKTNPAGSDVLRALITPADYRGSDGITVIVSFSGIMNNHDGITPMYTEPGKGFLPRSFVVVRANSTDLVAKTAAHEIGHALTLNHSASRKEIMYPNPPLGDQISAKDCDIARGDVAREYSSTPGAP